MSIQEAPIRSRGSGLDKDEPNHCSSREQCPTRAGSDASTPKQTEKKCGQQKSRDDACNTMQQNNHRIKNIWLRKGVEIGS